MRELIFCCRSMDVFPDKVGTSNNEHVGFRDGVVVEEGVKNESVFEVSSPLCKRARLLGDGVGRDP